MLGKNECMCLFLLLLVMGFFYNKEQFISGGCNCG